MPVTQAPPHDLDAERLVLGACLINPDQVPVVAELVTPDDFYGPVHADAFAVILDAHAEARRLDPHALAAAVDNLDAGTVTDWEAQVTASATAPAHAGRIRELRTRRMLAAAADDLARASRNGEAVADILDRHRNAIDTAGARTRPSDPARLLALSDVEPERVTWLWPGRIPRGKLTVLDGDPGAGKSTLATDLAARITSGAPMPDGTSALDGPAAVVYLSAEDGIGDTLRPRLDAAGGDPARFHVLDAVATSIEGRTEWRPPSIPRDCPILEEVVRRTGAVLVVVDVLAAYLDVRDGHADGDVRRALHPLAAVADRTGAAVVVIRHLRKSRGSAIYAGGGSIGVIGAARAGLIAAADPADETGLRRVLAVSKSNLAAIPPALAYELINAEEHGCARIRWTGPTAHRADDLLAIIGPEEHADAHDAASVLAEVLTDGPRWVKDALDAMAAAGFSKDQAKRAKSRLKVRSIKVGAPGDPESGWQWELPPREHEESEGSGDTAPAPFAPLVHPSGEEAA